jgi:hypothetical protein
VNGGDGEVGKIDLRVELLDRRIVPLGDRAEIDLGQRRAVDDEI